MRICELVIRNFGKFTNKKIDISDGIQLLYGENESGKSTIHSFIKGMFFGIERGRGRAAHNDVFSRYEPWDNPAYYSGMLRFESGGKMFCIYRDFDKVSKKVRVICESDGEELSAEDGDLETLLGEINVGVYDNTISVGQLKVETEEALSSELRNFATNYYAVGGGDMDITAALGNLKMRKKEIEKEIRLALEEKQKKREYTEQEASYVWRDIHKLQEEKERLTQEIELRKVREEKERENGETEAKGVIDEIRPEKWRVHPVEVLLLLVLIVAPVFFLRTPWSYMLSIILFLCGGIYVWNRMKVSKKQEKTEPERILEEITPQEEKASVEQLVWENKRITEELRDRKTQYENLKEQIEELEEVTDSFREQEKSRAAVQLAMDRLEELSAEFQRQMRQSLNQRVSEIIAQITGGKYTKLVVEDSMHVSLICEGRKISGEQVSRGTMEQIYFALRMAAAEFLCEEELPVILDDTFAYYDDARLANTLKWLAENKKQVLIFTCQNREEQALKKMQIAYTKEEV